MDLRLLRARRPARRRRFGPLLATAAALAGLACGAATLPRPQPEPAPPADRVPVVLVPGATGTALRDGATGRLAWGSGRRLLAPRDHGYQVALPLRDEPGTPRLRPAEVIEEIRLAGIVRRPIYGPVARRLEAAGYRRGDLARPRPGDTLFLFAYDWRHGSAHSARRLLERLEAVRLARGVERLAVDLVCQSNGGLICRYLAKYGGASVDEAEAGSGAPPEQIAVRKIALVGTSNGGSLRILRELDRGRRYVPWIGRRFRPETLFTFRSLFDDLPAYRDDLFLDERGEPLAIDLYSAATWEEHGWSIFSPAARRRVERSGRTDLFGDLDLRRRYLAGVLDRARRLHRLLARDVPAFDTRYDSIQNTSLPTPARAVLARDRRGRQRLRFTGDRWLARRPRLETLATARGDGHAAVASQSWLSPGEHARLVAPPLAVDGAHFELILAPETERRLRGFLSAPAPAAASPGAGG